MLDADDKKFGGGITQHSCSAVVRSEGRELVDSATNATQAGKV